MKLLITKKFDDEKMKMIEDDIMKLLITKKFDDEKMKMIEDLGYEIVFMEDRKLQNTPEVNSVDVACCLCVLLYFKA